MRRRRGGPATTLLAALARIGLVLLGALWAGGAMVTAAPLLFGLAAAGLAALFALRR